MTEEANDFQRKRAVQLARNAAEWEAWLEWKRECNVFRCSPNNQKLLSDVIFAAFKRKLERVSRVIYEDWKRNDYFASNDVNSRQIEFVSEFDFGIELKKNEGVKAKERIDRGEEPRRDETLTTASPKSQKLVRISPKDYKALAFNLAFAQTEDPLRAIRGQLIGPLGIINAIVEHYLLYTCGLSLDWVVDAETGKRSIGFIAKSIEVMEEKGRGKELVDAVEAIKAGSLSAPSGHIASFDETSQTEGQENEKPNSGTSALEPLDFFVNPDFDDVDTDALKEFQKYLRNTYKPRQMAILLAHLNAMPISSPALLSFYGAKHAAVDKAFHILVTMARDPATGKKIPVDIPGISALRNKFLGRLNFRKREVYLTIPMVFRETIAKEPGGEAFLSALSSGTTRKNGSAPRLRPAEPEL